MSDTGSVAVQRQLLALAKAQVLLAQAGISLPELGGDQQPESEMAKIFVRESVDVIGRIVVAGMGGCDEAASVTPKRIRELGEAAGEAIRRGFSRARGAI